MDKRGVFTNIMEKDNFPNKDVKEAMKAAPKTWEVAYHVIISGFTDELQNRVNALLAKGWQPIGGLAICQEIGGGYLYGQALIKY